MRNMNTLLFFALLLVFPSIGLCVAPEIKLPKELLFESYSETQRGHVLVVRSRKLSNDRCAVAYYGNKGALQPNTIWYLKGVFKEFDCEESNFPQQFDGK